MEQSPELIGARITKRRKELGLTQAELGDRLAEVQNSEAGGASSSQIGLDESGQRIKGWMKIWHYARALGTTPDTFFLDAKQVSDEERGRFLMFVAWWGGEMHKKHPSLGSLAQWKAEDIPDLWKWLGSLERKVEELRLSGASEAEISGVLQGAVLDPPPIPE